MSQQLQHRVQSTAYALESASSWDGSVHGTSGSDPLEMHLPSALPSRDLELSKDFARLSCHTEVKMHSRLLLLLVLPGLTAWSQLNVISSGPAGSQWYSTASGADMLRAE